MALLEVLATLEKKFGVSMPESEFPNITTINIELAGDTLVAFRTPGHSDDHVAYFLERQRVLFCGDLFTFQDIGTCDIAYLHSQSLERMSQSVRRCAALSPACVAPGHGRLTHRPERLFSAVEKRFELFARNPAMMVAHTILPLIVLLVEAREGATVDQLRSDTERHAPLFSDFLADLQGVEGDLDKLLLILAMKGIVSIENSHIYLRRDALGQAA